MICINFLHGVTGEVAEIPSPYKAIIYFELDGVLQTAYLKSQRFYKNGKHLCDNQNLQKFLKIGYKVKFSCHLIDNPDPGQCQWFVTSCWRHNDDKDTRLVMSTGIMNVAGTIIDLKQRHGTLLMTDLLGTEYRVHFLASKVYLFGKRVSSSKPLSSQLHIDDQVYFDAIPCFPEENRHNCNWFATCVHKGKKPEKLSYYVQNKVDSKDLLTAVEADDNLVGNEVLDNFSTINGSPTHCQQQEIDILENAVKQTGNSNEEFQSPEIFGVSDMEFLTEETSSKHIEPHPRLSAKMLQELKMVTNNPRAVFATTEGFILEILNEEYGVILGEFKRNIFQTILFHRSNAFLFGMSLANTKLTEIFIDGDRVRFIAVDAPKQFVCDWIAIQVSVACHGLAEDSDLPEEEITEGLPLE
ncbi:uncharacterized protein LOC105683091 [Athalia rosae]|uniref:uncharacterized protein LOC105683091 n=1 Tax=Athalia rosae TaxID=37344 RepID=UPI0020345F4A|nr:uncharacterized protein LOC105683091 [Athalia rosae]